MMRDKLLDLIKNLDPDIQELVAEVLEKERDYLDMLRPRGIKEEIRDLIDRHAQNDSDAGESK
jgi:uncharacterized protein YaaR (DUF327 family)